MGRILSLFVLVSAASSSVFASDTPSFTAKEEVTCRSFSRHALEAAILRVSRLADVSPEHLWMLSSVETTTGKTFGEPGAGFTDAHSRSLPFLLALSRSTGFDPSRICASRRGRGGTHGGALGSTQVLAHTWAGFIGLSIVREPSFTFSSSRSIRPGRSHADIRTLQRVLNRSGFLVSTDGPGSPGSETTFFGERTREALRRFQVQVMGSWITHGRCREEFESRVFGGCTKARLILEYSGIGLRYFPEEDRVLDLLGMEYSGDVRDMPTPWDPVYAVAVSALYLLDHGYDSDDPESIERAFRQYFTGARGNWRGRRASRYWNSIESALEDVPLYILED